MTQDFEMLLQANEEEEEKKRRKSSSQYVSRLNENERIFNGQATPLALSFSTSVSRIDQRRQ